ncbi:MAG: GNAT family N-acetyltransferase [Chloroflexota bacterium]|nr:GNAT family N-acetyltransferase [Chloroflexota bacterium]
MSPITISPYHAGDHDAVVALLDLITDDLGPDVLAVANAKPSRTIVVARDGAQTIGVIILALIEWSGDAHLRFLAVDPAYRNRGIGAALVTWARETATAAGMRRLYVDTSHNNVRGMQFYIRHGFIPEVCRFDFYKPGLHQVNLWLELPYIGDARTGRGGSGRATRAGNALTIDRYQEADKEVVISLIDAITWQGDGCGVLDNALRNDWEIFVAHDGDAPVGTLLLHSTRWNGTAHISMLSVLPDDQSQGVGAALVGAAKSLARERSLRRLTVGTGHANWRAQLFYLRNGFIPELCHHDFGGPGVHEVLLWQDL